MSECMMKIVAIIPLYNGRKYIEQALASVLGQRRMPDDVVVVDDGSADDGYTIVEEIAKRQPLVRLIRKQNGGQGSARNLGVKSSDCDLIAFLDQDDVWYPHHLEVLEKPFRADNPVPLGWVYSNADYVKEDGSMFHHSYLGAFDNEHPKRSVAACLRHDMHILPGASLISRAAFDRVGGFDERLIGYEDDDLFVRLFLAGYKNIFVDEALTQWRIYPGSASTTRKMAESRYIYFEKLVNRFENAEVARFYVRNYLIPRFLPSMKDDLLQAIKRGDAAEVGACSSRLRGMAKFLRRWPRKRVRLGTSLAALPYLSARMQRTLAKRLIPVCALSSGIADFLEASYEFVR